LYKRNLFTLFFILLLFISCKKEEYNNITKDWKQIRENGSNSTVYLHMWGGSSQINNFFTGHVSKELKEKYRIKLKVVPVINIRDSLNKLSIEKAVDKSKGNIDLMWINGENFKFAKDYDLLFKEITSYIPNIKNVEPISLEKDFGESVDKLEVPFGKARFILISDLPNPPKSANELMEWVKKNPGKFTYPNPNHFVGNAFIRTIAVDLLGKNEFTTEEMEPVWKYLNELKPYLWREGKTFPESSEVTHDLYSKGEISITMDYNPGTAELKVASGVFTKETVSYSFNVGSFINNHYMAVPYNSKNPQGAMIVLNYFLTKELQMTKKDPNHWGDGDVLINKNQKIKGLVELSPEITEKIKDEWYKNVAKN